MLQEKIASIPDHISNIHHYPDNKEYKECAHGDLNPHSKAWLDPESQAIEKLRSALNGKNGSRFEDLSMMTEFTHTGELGS